MRKYRREGGFTLVETAATVVLSSVALVATAGAVTSGARLARTAVETRAAVRSSKTMMERVRGTAFASIATKYNDTCSTLKTVGDGDSAGTCSVAVGDVDTGSTKWKVLKVTVTTRFGGASGDATRSFSTYVCDRTTGSALGTTQVIGADATTTTTTSTSGGTTSTSGTTSSGSTTTTTSSSGSSSSTPSATALRQRAKDRAK